ncbi:12559_t:CDS:2, partial [Gigaspora margarita]
MNYEEVESIIKEVLMKTKKSKDKNWDLKKRKIDNVKVVRADMCFIVLTEGPVDIEQDHLRIKMMNVDGLFDVRTLKRKLESELQSPSRRNKDIMAIRRVEVETSMWRNNFEGIISQANNACKSANNEKNDGLIDSLNPLIVRRLTKENCETLNVGPDISVEQK